MKALTTGIGLLTAIAVTLPAPAGAAEPVVPPENSAATQYTQTFPTAGGNKEAGGGGNRGRSPGDVIGKRNARRLESQGKTGREVAAVVAATAPVVSDAGGQAPPPARNGSGNGSGGAGNPPDGDRRGAPPSSTGTAADLSQGSSGLGEVLGEATGSSSSGGLGTLLPLAILATIAWALAYAWRRRQRAAQSK